MNLAIGKKALITTDSWFIAPDGRSYKAVFGMINGIFNAEETLGISTNERSTNWYVSIGNMVIAGCQIHYAIQTDHVNFLPALNWTADASNGYKEYQATTSIYDAD